MLFRYRRGTEHSHMVSYIQLPYKHQWNTRWAFARKLDIFACESTCYLHMWKYHLCYGYIINRAFHTKKLLKWNGLVAWRYKISLLLLKKYFTSERSERVKYFSPMEEKFRISAWPCNILYFCNSYKVTNGTPR